MLSSKLEQYLHDHIPLSKAMQVAVVSLTTDAVVLSAPLPPNINHRDTVFGGSASAMSGNMSDNAVNKDYFKDKLTGK